MSSPLYLDNNASTPILPEVLEAMLPWLESFHGNPSAGHPYGRRARRAIEVAREQVAGLLGCKPGEVLFTSGGTESNNLAIRGVAAAAPRGRHLVTSVVEHPAVEAPCRFLEGQGWQVTSAPVDATGTVSEAAVGSALRADTTLVTVMHANNETGAIQPIPEIAGKARSLGVPVHSDTAQSVGKLSVAVDELGVDLLTIAGHKVYAPKGVGALYVREGTPLEPFMLGAGHEGGLRPGTENVPSIVALGCACELARRDGREAAARMSALRDRLEALLRREVPGLELNGPVDQRLPNTLNVSFPGVSGSAVLEGAPGAAATTGSACHDDCEQPSGVLLAMGMTPERAAGAVRLSLGWATTEGQIEEAAGLLIASFSELP